MVRIHVSVKSQGVSKILHSFPGSSQVHGSYSRTDRTGFCGYIHILHATPQTRLYAVGPPSKNEHNKSPAQTCEDGPGICSYLFSELGGEELCGEGGDRDGG